MGAKPVEIDTRMIRPSGAASRFDKPVTAAIIGCYRYYIHNKSNETVLKSGTMYKLVKESLSNTLYGLCISYEGLYEGWRADADHPGYMIKLDQPNAVRAPVHLIPIFPSTTKLREIWAIANLVRLGTTSTICLSGSNALGSALTTINDVDFCEYLRAKPDNIERMILANAGASQALCAKLNAGSDGTWLWPTPTELTDIIEAIDRLNPNESANASCKADFLCMAESSGAWEVSSKGIMCDAHGHSAALAQTFSAQEAPLEMSSWIPTQFVEPIEMGRYVSWLGEQVEQLRMNGHYVKALKRGLSLTRVTFLAGFTDQILALFQDSTAGEEDEIDAMRALLERHRDIERPGVAAALRVVQKQIELKEAQLELRRFHHESAPRSVFEERAQILLDDLVGTLKAAAA